MIGLTEGGELSADAPPPPSRVREIAADIFADGGWLCDALKLEHRPQQENMALAVAAAMHGDRNLICEAGTGVGKSLAYLLPGIIFATDRKRQMIVSTHTISLQEQIEHKDLALCRRLFSAVPELEAYSRFKSTLLVGKANYLCTTRLAMALQAQESLFSSPERTELVRLAEWARTSKDGLRHELNPPPLPEVWEQVNADSAACSRKRCDGTCFYQRAKGRVRDAQVIIVNHSLLFALLAIGGAASGESARGILFPDDFAVLDEAHTIAEVATDHFGLSVSSFGCDRLLKALHHPDKNRGLLAKLGKPEEKLLVADAIEAAVQFFGFLNDQVLVQQARMRVRTEGICEPWLEKPLTQLVAGLDRIATRMEDGPARDEIVDHQARVKAYQSGIRQFLNLANEDHVYWVERTGRRGHIVTLRSAPLDVAPYLREQLFRRNTSVTLTSATLAIGGSMEPFQQRNGAEDAGTCIEHSPFDYERVMRVYVAADVSPPNAQDARLDLEGLIDYLDFCIRRVPGGSLVLFTSYRDLRAAADALQGPLEKDGRTFLMQGGDVSRTELAQRLREAGNGVLFGTDSFWTGVDIPGRALSQVIITRLPFEMPTEPVAEARAEWVRERGGHPFNEITLPDALVKFRQGIGRLIRSKTDRGVVTLLDSRLLAKPYGREFLGALPSSSFERLTRANRAEIFRPFP
ncbi:MAG TPA: ATP-dependent DNA helicase [Candidatus Didemnitutus sp.]|nr:ATP-dependent DNA helicase [Candidatus Didemnitutus sp.]